jgi:hypothetical protein
MRTRLLVFAIGSSLLSLGSWADTTVKCSVKTLSSCPKIGCSKPGSPLAATNSKKRATVVKGAPTVISFSDLKDLQAGVDQKFANGPILIKGTKVSSYHNMKATPRKIILSGLRTASGNFSEGDFVELVGFIAATKLPPHPNTGESVNCNLKDEPSNDYHINITPAKNGDETEGIVVEMIPQSPNRKSKDWNLDKLKKVQTDQLPVKIQGQLFFDSEHKPNTRKSGKAGGNPRRFSLWEIHPISSFLVCQSNSCSGNSGWKAIEDWNLTH